MSIELRVIDPKNTDPAELKNAIRFLAAAAGLTVTFGDTNGLIAPDDNPAAGLNAAEIFGNQGNGQPAPFTAGAGTLPIVPAGTLATLPNPNGVSPFAPLGAPLGLPVVPPTGNPAPTGERDAAGFLHDPRIHSSSKTRNADGRWKKRKGVDDATVAQVEGELRQLMSVPSPAPNPTLAQLFNPNPQPVTPGVPDVPNGGGVFPFAPPPNLTLPAALPGASDGANGTTAALATTPGLPPLPVRVINYPELMMKINTAVMSQQLSEASVHQVLTSLGLPPQPALLAQRLEYVPHVAQMLFGNTNP